MAEGCLAWEEEPFSQKWKGKGEGDGKLNKTGVEDTDERGKQSGGWCARGDRVQAQAGQRLAL